MKPFTQRAKSPVAAAPTPSVRRTPAAPAPFRPQSTPIVLQRKTVGPLLKPPQADRLRSMPPNVQQQKTSALQPKTPPAAPPVYRPLPVPKVLQRKTSETHRPPVQPRAQSAHRAGLIQRSVPRSQAAAVIQRAEQHQFVMGISERTDVTPQSGFATIAKLTINGEDICHTKSGKLVNDCTSAHAEDVAVEVLKDKCWDAAAGRASPIVAGQLNEVWLYISSSPCTSESRGGRPATSTKDIGCTEMLINIQHNGMPSTGSLWAYGLVNGHAGPTFQIRFNIECDKLYQPQAGPGMGPLGGGKDASRRAVSALEGAGAQIF